MQNRNISSVLFRTRAAALTAATTVVLSGMSIASATDLPKVPASLSDAGPFTISLAGPGVAANRNNVADTSSGHGSSDVARTYTGGATGAFATPGDWGGTALGAGDAPTINASPTGNIALTNNETGLTFGDFIENRGVLASTVTLTGGYTGNRIEVTSGGLVLDGGTTTVNADFNLNTDPSTLYGFRIGVGAGAPGGSLVIQNNAQIGYHDFLHGSLSGTGSVLITGAGTVLTPVQGANIRADFRGGGGGTSTVTVTNGATVTANLVLPNNGDTTTISNGATFNANNYTTTSNFGGQIEVGYWPVASGPAPVSTYTVDNATVNTTFFDVATGDNVNSLVTVKNGGKLNAGNSFSTNAAGAIGTFNIQGAGSVMTGNGAFVGGGDSGDAGTGTTIMNITAGGSVNYAQAQFGGNNGLVAGDNYAGTTINVDGAGSSFKLVGRPRTNTDPTASDAVDGSLFLNNESIVTATINVTNGGLFDLLSTDADPVRNGALVMAQGSSATTTINVTGAGSTFSAGNFVQCSQVSDASTATVDGSVSTFNVKDGGSFVTTDDGGDFGGNMQFGIAGDATLISPDASIAINVGGGSTAADSDSLFSAGGGMFLGGGGTFAAPSYGIPVTVNVNNGELSAGAIIVGRTSTVNLHKGQLIAGLVSVRGGTIKLDTAAPAGTGVLAAGGYEINTGGSIDIGRSGGMSFIVTGDTVDDLTQIKALLLAGRTGTGVNGIMSSAITSPSGPLAIGYALRPANSPVTSFLGFPLDPTDNVVLFRLTFRGDADLSGKVDFNDLVFLAQNYNGTGKEWYQGDFNFDGTVDFNDLVPLAQNYNSVFSLEQAEALGGADFAHDWALAMSLVPEPTTLSLAVAAVGLVSRRRR